MKKNWNSRLKQAVQQDEPRALKIMRDFTQHKRSLEDEKKEPEAPVEYHDEPDKMLSPQEFTSICYGRILSPLEILMEKEDAATDPDRQWDKKYAMYRRAFLKMSDEVLVRLGGGGGVLVGDDNGESKSAANGPSVRISDRLG